MKKLIVLVLAFAIVAPALADDLAPAPWAQDEFGDRVMPTGNDPCVPVKWSGPQQLWGTTYSEWTYDSQRLWGISAEDAYGAPDNSWFVSHPAKEDPYVGGGGEFGGQWWGGPSDPCGIVYRESIGERTGIITFGFGSWDIDNFVHDQPAKDVWMQLTYMPDPCGSSFYFGPVVGFDIPIEDPCEWYETGWWEGMLADWPGDPGVLLETWLEDPCDPCSGAGYWWDEPLDTLDPCQIAVLFSTWLQDAEWGEEELVLVSETPLGDGFIHAVFAATLPINPEWEFMEMEMDGDILIDQLIIETLCYVPEPATMALLGLGSLLMIRRRKR